jgi:2-polyprenyl-3-methyl-5-hydroxy-6-metoxy-1,4-benzoquinol methylase
MTKQYKEQLYFEGLSPDSVMKQVITGTVKEILQLAKKELRKPISSLTVLDVGSGWGEYAFELEKHVKEVTAVEPYKKLYSQALKNKKLRKSKVSFHNTLIEDFRTKKKFDIILSLTTIEHMPEVVKSFENIYSLMSDKSIIYITAPNKLWPLEPHYRIPFLSILPLSVANLLVRVSKRGQSFEDSSYALSYAQTRKLLNRFEWSYSFLLPDPDAVYLGCGKDSRTNKLIKKYGILFIKNFPFMWTFSKGFIILAKKDKRKH